MSLLPPDDNRILLEMFREQLAQKDSQIASLTSLLQDANQRLAQQQRILESMISAVPARNDTAGSLAGMALRLQPESSAAPDGSVTVDHANRQNAAPDMRIRTAPPENEPRISMSYFNAPLTGIADRLKSSAAAPIEETSAGEPSDGSSDPGDDIVFAQPEKDSTGKKGFGFWRRP